MKINGEFYLIDSNNKKKFETNRDNVRGNQVQRN